MKLFAAAFAAVAVGVGALLAIPLVFANGGPATAAYGCGQIGVILDTIRTLESGSDYTAKAANATASGAYQYIDATWRAWAIKVGIDTVEYPSASMAPPEAQDRVAAANVNDILTNNDSQVETVPIVWYYPAALGDPELLDTVPYPSAGNTLTIREYQTTWLDTYNTKLAAAVDTTCTAAVTVDGLWALPVDRDAVTANQLDQGHHDYPAIDIVIPTGSAAYALTNGTVTVTHHFARNWFEAGCQTDATGCSTCGIGVTITTTTGWRYTYCHLSRLDVTDAGSVTAGQLVGLAGNTGRSGTPHLHLELRTPDGTQRCPQPLLSAIYAPTAIPDPATLPTTGCSF